jgi:hypothetical protein
MSGSKSNPRSKPRPGYKKRNAERAERARAAVQYYREKFMHDDRSLDEISEEDIIDLMVDLLHLADREDLSPKGLPNWIEQQFNLERQGLDQE